MIKSVVFLCLMSTPFLSATDWHSWRGPHQNGVSEETGLPVNWGPEQNIAWRYELPGPGPATPVISGDRIYLTSANGEDLVLLSLSTKGELLWERKLGTGNRDIRQGESNFAASSPTTDGKHVYAFIGTGDLICFDMDGTEKWRKNISEIYGTFKMYFGMASTPLLDNGVIYLGLMHDNAQNVVALDGETGKELWNHKRETDARVECLHSYASPVIYRHNGLEQLLIHGADYITAHALKDGAEIWRSGGLQGDNYNDFFRFVATPAISEGLIVVPSAKNGPVLGINPVGAKGNITNNKEAFHWKRPANTPDVPSPAVHDGIVYLCRENGVLIAMDAKTGEEFYMERTHSFRHRGSPLVADGKVYLMAEDGVVTVVKAGKTFEKLATNDIGERTAASLAVSNKTLYLRTHKALYAIRQ